MEDTTILVKYIPQQFRWGKKGITMNIPANYKAHVYAELKHDVDKMNKTNSKQTTKTRPMTKEEIEQIFGDNPDYIKNISSTEDKHEWLLANWFLLDNKDKVYDFINCISKCKKDVFIVDGGKDLVAQYFKTVHFKEPIFVKYDNIDKDTIMSYLGEYITGAPVKEMANEYKEFGNEG